MFKIKTIYDVKDYDNFKSYPFIFHLNSIFILVIFIKDILFDNLKGHNLFVKL